MPGPVPFVDTHIHLWDRSQTQLTWNWLDAGGDPGETAVLGEYGSIRSERFSIDDLLAESRAAAPSHFIHVQAANGSQDPVEETAWLSAEFDRRDVAGAIVGHVDLDDSAAVETIGRHTAYQRFRGVRDLRLPENYDNPAIDAPLQEMAGRGLVLCDAVDVSNVGTILKLLQRHTDLTLCVDHTMMPMARDDEYFATWSAALADLAAAPNTVVKISGLGQVDHEWTVDSIRPWVLAAIQAFGTQRAFFGTNWPVDRLYSSYPDVIAAYREICEEFTVEERENLLSGNACRIFDLTP